MAETNHDDVSEGAHLPSLAGVRADAAVRGRGRPEEPHQLRHGPKHFQEPAEGNHLSCFPRIIFILSTIKLVYFHYSNLCSELQRLAVPAAEAGGGHQ